MLEFDRLNLKARLNSQQRALSFVGGFECKCF